VERKRLRCRRKLVDFGYTCKASVCGANHGTGLMLIDQGLAGLSGGAMGVGTKSHDASGNRDLTASQSEVGFDKIK